MRHSLATLWAVPLLGLLLASCQPARQYPPLVKASKPDQEADGKPVPAPLTFEWINARPPGDIPIVFVPSTSEEWDRLPEFWNHQGGGVAGQRTIHLGQSPLGAVVALQAAAHLEVIKVKVPLGLPDPTPNIPPTNRPTHGKWLLGKKLFFDKTLLTGVSRHLSQSCSDCHRPAEGYTVNSERTPTMPRLNPPTLINCVYNKRQFWDGRVAHLEEVIQRTLEDEPAPGKPPEEDVLGYRHAWPEVVAKVRRRYNEDFVRVFGSVATQDSIGKALATYMRTILSGHSVYDRAEAERIKAKAPTLQADHFEPFLNERTREALGAQKLTAGQTAVELRHGAELFRGKARCALCHGGPLFTDQDYHNLGVGESEYARNGTRGLETGRFPHLPAGLKDRRYIGAFATPTLRALPRTAPYMHDGSRGSLEGVVKYFNSGIDAEDNPYLAPELLEGRGKARKLDLDDRDVRALVLFLRALDGDPIPKIVAEP